MLRRIGRCPRTAPSRDHARPFCVTVKNSEEIAASPEANPFADSDSSRSAIAGLERIDRRVAVPREYVPGPVEADRLRELVVRLERNVEDW